MSRMKHGNNRFIFVFSGLMIAAVVLWYACILADRKFLAERTGTAVVTAKEYRPFSEKFQVQSVGGRTQTVKLTVPEAWLVTLDLDGRTSQAEVSREEYGRIREGDRMDVAYKRYRITGAWQVTRVLAKADD